MDRDKEWAAKIKKRADERLNEALEESFPASDPPSITQPSRASRRGSDAGPPPRQAPKPGQAKR